jgi:SAM-dependent methyltransferase
LKTIISLLVRYVPRKYLQRLSSVALRFTGLFYRGKAVQCPICLAQYREFLPYGRINPRANALCPNCLSLERHRLIWLYLQQRTDFFAQPRQVLHLAPEACFMERFEKIHGQGYITADIESPLAKVKTDIHQMPFADNQFDVVLCNHVLEHVDNDIQAMAEIARVLKPGGWAILQVPFFFPVPEVTVEDLSVTDPRQREKLFGQADHVRKFGKDYPSRIEKAGLAAVADAFAATLPNPKHVGIAPNEMLYIGVKREQG